jgi:hypothetical protein
MVNKIVQNLSKCYGTRIQISVFKERIISPCPEQEESSPENQTQFLKG